MHSGPFLLEHLAHAVHIIRRRDAEGKFEGTIKRGSVLEAALAGNVVQRVVRVFHEQLGSVVNDRAWQNEVASNSNGVVMAILFLIIIFYFIYM